MKIFILIISVLLGSNIDVNISPIDINHDNKQRETIKREKGIKRETIKREKVDNQDYNVPSGYRHRGGNTYAYGEWFVSFTNYETVQPYGLDNYSRTEYYDFNRTYNNKKVNFKIYKTNDERGYYALARLRGNSRYIRYVTIGVYKSGRYALSSSFDYKKHITKIYEYVYKNN